MMLHCRKRGFYDLRYIGNCFIRYKSESCGSDTDHSDAACSTSSKDACDVCRAYPCECNPSAPTMYDRRKYGHNLPCDSAAPYFETLPNFPTGIFRCTAGEVCSCLKLVYFVKVLGRGTNKCSYYQNPEYFSYHHMSFYDMHMLLRCYRKQSPKTGRKP